MDPQPAQLDALVAIVDLGTFDAAARHLHVTPSAVSQRVRALESAAGRVLVTRTTPCRPTAAGEALLRLARQSRLLRDEARAALDAGPRELAVAVNADSLATWFRDVLAVLADTGDVAVRLHVDDQAWSARLLRSGEVLAAVTSDPEPVQGCSSEPLGVLRYRPASAPAFAARWPDWDRAPVVVFDEKDALQHDLLRARGVGLPALVHRVPTSADFHEAVRLGLGWGLVPEPQLLPDVSDGRLVVLDEAPVDVALHWQRWRLDSPLLADLTDVVRHAARDRLRPVAAGTAPVGGAP